MIEKFLSRSNEYFKYYIILKEDLKKSETIFFNKVGWKRLGAT